MTAEKERKMKTNKMHCGDIMRHKIDNKFQTKSQRSGSECIILRKGLCAMKGCMEGWVHGTEQNKTEEDRTGQRACEYSVSQSVSPNRTNQNQLSPLLAKIFLSTSFFVQ